MLYALARCTERPALSLSGGRGRFEQTEAEDWHRNDFSTCAFSRRRNDSHLWKPDCSHATEASEFARFG
jgi:hypothetical protein